MPILNPQKIIRKGSIPLGELFPRGFLLNRVPPSKRNPRRLNSPLYKGVQMRKGQQFLFGRQSVSLVVLSCTPFYYCHLRVDIVNTSFIGKTMKCLKKIECQTKMKFFPSKISDFIKKMKPVVKFMTNRHRTNSVTPSTCNYDIKMAAESEKADFGVDFLDVHFKFVDEVAENKANEDSESYENERNEQLENRFLKISAKGKSRPETTYSAAPVRFFVSECGELMWAPLADADIRCRGDLSITECQKPGIQSPVGVF